MANDKVPLLLMKKLICSVNFYLFLYQDKLPSISHHDKFSKLKSNECRLSHCNSMNKSLFSLWHDHIDGMVLGWELDLQWVNQRQMTSDPNVNLVIVLGRFPIFFVGLSVYALFCDSLFMLRMNACTPSILALLLPLKTTAL